VRRAFLHACSVAHLQYALLEHVVHGVVVQAHNCWQPSGLCTCVHTFMSTQPAQFMFSFFVCMVILAVAQVLYVSWDCLGVRTACPAYVLVRSDLLCRGAALLHHHSLFVMLCTNNCHVCWKLKHNSLLPISLCAR